MILGENDVACCYSARKFGQMVEVPLPGYMAV
jgi:hypothetical protein